MDPVVRHAAWRVSAVQMNPSPAIDVLATDPLRGVNELELRITRERHTFS
jgi:hypothetical protein